MERGICLRINAKKSYRLINSTLRCEFKTLLSLIPPGNAISGGFENSDSAGSAGTGAVHQTPRATTCFPQIVD
jgi:hypothetical protein